MSVTSPSTVPVFGDCSFPVSNDPHYYDSRYVRDLTSSLDPSSTAIITNYNMLRFFIDRHDLTVNMLMADWSVKRVGLKHVFRLRWHRDWEKTMTDPFDGIRWPAWAAKARDVIY